MGKQFFIIYLKNAQPFYNKYFLQTTKSIKKKCYEQ